ncbi:PREDICTED: glutathione synthetase, chloroplastic-like isoform X3 [Nelumbo nucifera]|uniref:Glutathione synthetase n=1 Tax=Nelumbo nucifera TaxID=4432 RepID=A0A1U8Q2Z5_NELNU|nr:PREDICTED: glutathione synthetase, chloroplastic-like isoform X3 [Nelumbo nucifera]
MAARSFQNQLLQGRNTLRENSGNMGAACSSSLSLSLPPTDTLLPYKPKPHFPFNSIINIFQTQLQKPRKTMIQSSHSSLSSSSSFHLKCETFEEKETQDEATSMRPMACLHNINPKLLQQLVYDALVWSSLHGLVVGDRSVQKRSGTVPGVGMVHAPFALLPMSFPRSHWQQACELAPLFNELVDRVSLDGKFLQDSLSRYLLDHNGKHLGFDPKRVPGNDAVSQYAEALAKAWNEYNNSRAFVMIVVQAEELNMYDQHWLCTTLKERYDVTTIRRTLAEIDAEGELLPDGTLLVGGQEIAVIYFRAGYTPNDYPSESEWRARLLVEQSSAIKCPSISYHLTGTKKIQQELAKPNVLERFLENKDDISKLRKCFAGLWSLDDSSVVKNAIESPELFVLKPQREGGGNNIYGDNVREILLKLEQEGREELAAYILMQRIFPTASSAFLVRDGIYHQENAISELGIYSAYLRNKEKVIMNDQCGYLVRTKVSSSNEGGIAAGYAVLDSIYLN